MPKRYWLMKSEPDVFSIQDLEKMHPKSEHWDGVRNYQARNFMRDDMQIGDEIFFYHSNCKPPGIVGIAQVSKDSYPDHTSWDKKSKYFDEKSTKDKPRWFMVDVQWKETFADTVSLDELKEHPELSEMRVIQKGSRLSITPVTKAEFQFIKKLGKNKKSAQ